MESFGKVEEFAGDSLLISVLITLLGAHYMRMEFFGTFEEFAETLLVEDNGEQHEEHGTQEEEVVEVDVDSTDGVIHVKSNEAEEEPYHPKSNLFG